MIAGVVIAGVVIAGVVIAGVVIAGVVIAGVVIAGVVIAGVVIAGVVIAGVVIAGVVIVGVVIVGVVIVGVVTPGVATAGGVAGTTLGMGTTASTAMISGTITETEIPPPGIGTTVASVPPTSTPAPVNMARASFSGTVSRWIESSPSNGLTRFATGSSGSPFLILSMAVPLLSASPKAPCTVFTKCEANRLAFLPCSLTKCSSTASLTGGRRSLSSLKKSCQPASRSRRLMPNRWYCRS